MINKINHKIMIKIRINSLLMRKVKVAIQINLMETIKVTVL
jgi:hypothetical protein